MGNDIYQSRYEHADCNRSYDEMPVNCRCIKQYGKSVTFILADDKALSLLKQRGYYAIVLHTDWNNMEGELPALRKVITENQIDKMLIDSYQVTEKYLKELSRFVKIVYMDDLNEFDYPVDAIICYANYWKKFNYQ